MKSVYAAIVLLLAVLLTAGNATASIIYALSSGSPGGLYTIDPTSGAATNVMTLGYQVGLTGITFLNGQLYASNIISGGYSTGTIDLKTGDFTSISNQQGTANWQGIVAVPTENLIYVTADGPTGNRLSTMDPSGVVTPKYGSSLPTQFSDLAYDAINQVMYGVDNSTLYIINRQTGFATPVGSGFGVSGFQGYLGLVYVSQTNTLLLNDGSNHNLYSVDPASGLANLIGANGVSANLNSLAILETAADTSPVPEVPTTLLSACGLALMMASWIRRQSDEW